MPELHVRAQIRAQVKAMVTGLPTTAGRVFSGRTAPIQRSEKPLLLIWSREEPVKASGQGRPAVLERMFQVVVEAVVENKDSGQLEDDLDAIAVEVEGAIGADPHLGGLASDTQLVRTDWDFDQAGSVPNARLGMAFNIEYQTTEADAPTVS